VQVVAIAVVIGLGTGVYAGLGSTAAWRRESNDASYAALGMFDLKAALAEGTSVEQGALLRAVAALPAGTVADAEERLLVPTQVDASRGSETVLVPGRVVGVDVGAGGPHVNGLHVDRGRSLAAADSARPVGVLERHFAEFYDLPPAGRLRVGGADVAYVGTALSPEYFMVTTATGNFLAEANFAVLFTSLATAQQLAGTPGQVNDVVVRLEPGVDTAGAQAQLQRAVRTTLPGAAVTISSRLDDDVHRLLYEDIDNDQKFWNVIAFLILSGAVVAAFNLIGRMVEAQRRQIGVGMALGVPPARLALRPLLAGAEVAVLGVAVGAGIALLVMAGMRSLFQSFLPLPVWRTAFQIVPFVQGALLGLLLPLLATAWPVWRAVRVTPVDAIRTGHLAARGFRLAALARRIPVGRRTTARMPVRNVLRAPRRTLLTAFGIGAAITALVGTLGMIDSFLGTLDKGEDELLRGRTERVTVDLSGFQPADSQAVAAVAAAPASGRVEPSLRLGATVQANGTGFEVLVDVIDLRRAMWRPTIVAGGQAPLTGGLVLAEKAATDLGVAPGDEVTLVHPRRTGPTSFTLRRSQVRVAALHPNPMRFATYVDRSLAEPLFGMGDAVNVVTVEPAAGATVDDVKRQLFGVPGVASVQPVAAMAQLFRDAIDEFVGILQLLQLFVLVLAVLIAFNATSVSVDERARDHATMFAFGLRVRTVLRMNVTEGLATGLLGTAVGIVLGGVVVRWMIGSLLPQTMPDIGLSATVSPQTLGSALALGVGAVALAPLLTWRRLRRMDVPGTLRVAE
jgi:putative ABC transport system permease protein